MGRLLMQWVLSAVALMLVAQLVPGFYVQGFLAALAAALVIGLLNATVGFVLKILALPLTVLTLGLFLLVINGLMILLAAHFVRGFAVHGFIPAFWGAVVMAVLGVVIRSVTKSAK